jgi:hypothetical protein
MKRVFLFVHSGAPLTDEDWKARINSRSEILNWYKCMPNSFFIVSELSADAMTDMLRELAGNGGFQFVIECSGQRQGYLPKRGWEFINNPKAANET